MIDQRAGGVSKSALNDNLMLKVCSNIVLKFNLDIVPVYITRKPNNNFEIEIYEQEMNTKVINRKIRFFIFYKIK